MNKNEELYCFSTLSHGLALIAVVIDYVRTIHSNRFIDIRFTIIYGWPEMIPFQSLLLQCIITERRWLLIFDKSDWFIVVNLDLKINLQIIKTLIQFFCLSLLTINTPVTIKTSKGLSVGSFYVRVLSVIDWTDSPEQIKPVRSTVPIIGEEGLVVFGEPTSS